MMIQCRQVYKRYADRTVLRDVDLEIMPGELFGLVGQNGSGKSTLMRSILDLVAIDGGEIRIGGMFHRKVQARRDTAYLPDRFSPPPHLRGRDFIDYMLRLHGARRDPARIQGLLQALDLPADTLQQPVNRLSKGMSQKLGLAACLLSGKKLLMLDEPMSGLDPRARALLKQQLQQWKQQGGTVFFSSHMLADVEELADRMAVLHQGSIRYCGTPDDFRQRYQAQSVEQAYMECISEG